MRKIKGLIFLFILGIGMSSCATYTLPSMVTENEMGEKVGRSSYTTILGISFDRDRGLAEAARNGNISKISTVDFEIEDNFFTKTYTTVVTGK